MVQLYSKVTDMNKDNDISNDDVSEYNNYNLYKCLEEYYDFYEKCCKKEEKMEKICFDIFSFGVYCCFGLFSFKDIILV